MKHKKDGDPSAPIPPVAGRLSFRDLFSCYYIIYEKDFKYGTVDLFSLFGKNPFSFLAEFEKSCILIAPFQKIKRNCYDPL